MFLAIINDTYADVKTEMALAPDKMQMAEFMKRGYYNFLRRCGCQAPSESVAALKNEFEATIDEIRGLLKR